MGHSKRWLALNRGHVVAAPHHLGGHAGSLRAGDKALDVATREAWYKQAVDEDTTMVRTTDRGGDFVAQATTLARDISRDIDCIVLTHYADRDTLDTLRPGETDLAAVLAVNRAVAAELAALGVEVFVQRADRAAFRRWMHGRDDTPQNRRSWIDRTKLLRGAAALAVLGLEAPAAPRPLTFAKAPGSIADRLVASFNDDEGTGFEELAQALLGAGRSDVLDLAVRKLAERQGEEFADDLDEVLLASAAGARLGPAGWAGLVTLPVALPAHQVPDAEAMGDSLLRSGAIAETVEIRFLAGWRSPDALAALSPMAIRRVLLDCLAGAEPADFPPGDTDDLAKQGFGILLGIQFDWDIPVWDEIAAAGGLPDADDAGQDESPDEARRTALFNRWRGAMFDAHEGCVPLALVPPEEVEAEIAAFLEEADESAGAIDDIRQFIAVAQREAGGEDIVCRPQIIGAGLELSLFTATGRFLDSFAMPAERMPGTSEETLRLIESLVRVVKDAPEG